MELQTRRWKIDHEAESGAAAIREAAGLIRAGKLVAFPTETVYGLGADATSDAAVRGIFAAKGRPADNPLIVHIADLSQLDELTENRPPLADQLAAQFWPGPLTLVLPLKKGAVSPLVTAGLPTVAVRMPDHPVALALIRSAGCPIAAPSANVSGRPSPTTARHVSEDMLGRIAGILDGGPTSVGVESTVVAVPDNTIEILRPGGITAEQLAAAAGKAAVAAVAPEDNRHAAQDAHKPRAPGMKYKHYAPRGCLTVVSGYDHDAVARYINEQLAAPGKRGETVGVLTFAEYAESYNADLVLSLGSVRDLRQAANRLFACLRRFDEHGVSHIWAEACAEQGIGQAVMNRLQKAAAGRVVKI
ncbi:MAG TPA: L-threonylcarbamoyladenylate synthase [Bacilli bacterium]